MKRILTPLVVIGVLIFLATPAPADWDETDSSKWAQLPDPNGWDVSFTWPGTVEFPLKLADDFLCRHTGPINDIHLWVSLQGDYSPGGSLPLITRIRAEIWNNEDLPTLAFPTRAKRWCVFSEATDLRVFDLGLGTMKPWLGASGRRLELTEVILLPRSPADFVVWRGALPSSMAVRSLVWRQ